MKKILWLLIVFGFFFINKAVDSVLPQPYAWVNDYAELLDADEEKILNDSLQLLEKLSSTQVFIAIVENIPESSYLEKYSHDLATEWKVGTKGNNNGVLLLVSLSDRKMRIEVGYGLEGVLTDALSRRIIDNEILPEFKNRNYFAGLANGATAITKAVKGEYKGKEKEDAELGIGGTIFMVIIIILILLSKIGRGGSNRRGGKGMWIGSSGSGWSSFSSGGGAGFSGGGGGSFGGGGASGSW